MEAETGSSLCFFVDIMGCQLSITQSVHSSVHTAAETLPSALTCRRCGGLGVVTMAGSHGNGSSLPQLPFQEERRRDTGGGEKQEERGRGGGEEGEEKEERWRRKWDGWRKRKRKKMRL